MGLWQRITSSLGSAFGQKTASPDWGTLERYLAWSFGGGASASGVIVTPQTAMQSAAVYACVKVLSESVAMLPLNLQRKGTDGARTIADDHPLQPLIHDQPNDFQSSVEFWEMMVMHLCLRGNAYAYINRTRRGEVVELLPQHPDMVRVVMNPDYTLAYQLAMPNGSFQQYEPGQILHLRGLTTNGWLGISPIAYARESIGLALATEKFGSQLFRNGAKMGGVLEHPGKLTDQAYARIKESFDVATSGENAHKTAVLEEGMKFSKVSMNADDAQFLATRQYQRSEIASIFRVPPHLIGDLSRSTFSNIEQQSLEFVNFSLAPWLVRIEKAIKRDLLSDAEKREFTPKFNTAGLLRGDAASRAAYYHAGILDGWLTRNEARAAESEMGTVLNPLDELDEPLMPLNMVPVSEEPGETEGGVAGAAEPADTEIEVEEEANGSD